MERITADWRDARFGSCHPGSGIRTNDRIISGEGGGDHEVRHTSRYNNCGDSHTRYAGDSHVSLPLSVGKLVDAMLLVTNGCFL
jgi:hypothetical protein